MPEMDDALDCSSSGVITSSTLNYVTCHIVSENLFGIRSPVILCIEIGYRGQIVFQELTASLLCFLRLNMLLMIPEAGIQVAQEPASIRPVNGFNASLLDKTSNH